MTLTRPRRRGAALAAALLSTALLLTACSGNDAPEGTIDNSPAAGNDAFPVTVTTTYGETTLYEKPERIVALGMSNLDILTSLGVTPVAFADDGYTVNGGSPDFSNAPWVDGKVSADLWDVGLADGEVNAEAIAAYDPDLLIVGTRDAEDGNMYETLSEIAPVYVIPSASEWQKDTTEIGQLTGKSTEAEEQIAAVEKAYEDAQSSLPGLQGRTYNIGALDAGEIWIEGPWTFLSDLGLVPADNQPAEDIQNMSMENVDQLQADVMVLVAYDDATTDTFKSDPRVASLPSSENGTLIYLPANFLGAAHRAGPLNRLWVKDQMVSYLEKTPLNQEGN